MFHWKDMGCKQTAYKNQLKFSMKTQNVNFFTFVVRCIHNSEQGSSALKHVHFPVHPCIGFQYNYNYFTETRYYRMEYCNIKSAYIWKEISHNKISALSPYFSERITSSLFHYK